MSNIEKLTDAGIIPKGYDRLTEDEKSAINSLCAEEVDAIISASEKIYPLMEAHQPHGMAY